MSGVHLEQWSPWYLVSKELCRRSKELSQTVLQCSRHNTGNTRQQHWPHWYLVRYWAPVNNVIRPALKQWLCIFIYIFMCYQIFLCLNKWQIFLCCYDWNACAELLLQCCMRWIQTRSVICVSNPSPTTAEQCVCIPVKITDSELFWIWQLQIWL